MVEGERRTTGQPEAPELISAHFKNETEDGIDAALDAAFARGMALGAKTERERCREIVFRLLGSEFTGNQVLEEINQ